VDTTKIVIVEWIDAMTVGSWESEVKPTLATCITVGFVVAEDNDCIVIASTVSDNMSNCHMHIPKRWINKRRSLSIETKQRKSKRKNVPAMGTRPDHRSIPA
jgi:hypothetical protein